MSGLFIVSTSSKIGKTILISGLAMLFNNSGIKTGYMKPIDSGDNFSLDSFLIKKLTNNTTEATISNVILFKNNLVPVVASELENIEIKLNKILMAYKFIEKKYNIILVEGMNSAYLPIKKNYNLSDMIGTLKIPCLIISELGIDTVNDVLLTIEYLKKKNIHIIGYCLSNKNNIDKRDFIYSAYPKLIHNFTQLEYFGTIPYIKDLEIYNNVKEESITKLNLDKFKESIKKAITSEINYQHILKQTLINNRQ